MTKREKFKEVFGMVPIGIDLLCINPEADGKGCKLLLTGVVDRCTECEWCGNYWDKEYEEEK